MIRKKEAERIFEMYIFHVTYTAPDRETILQFWDALCKANIAARTQAEPGNGEYHYYFPAEPGRENQLFLVECWPTKEALIAHQEYDHFKEMGELKKQFNLETRLVKYKIPD